MSSSVLTLIGLIDQCINTNKQMSWDVNKIGGKPSWLVSSLSNTSEAKPACRVCGRPSSLVCQLYCPLGGSPYHRCLYVFTCVSKCSRQREGWTVLRSMKFDETYNISHATRDSTAMTETDDWTDDQDDWGQGSTDEWGQGSGDWVHGSLGDDKSEDNVCPIRPTDTQHQISPLDQNTESECLDDRRMDGCTAENEQSGKDMIVHEVEKQSAVFSQLHLSEHDSAKSSADETNIDGDTGDCVLPKTEDDRWTAVVGLLNTRERQNSEASEGVNPSSLAPLELKPYYLAVIEEPHKESQDLSGHVTELMEAYEKTEGVSLASMGKESTKSSKAKGTETYEKTELKHGDKFFHKFMKRLQRCPEQCVRYERGGSPLLMSDLEGHRLSPCAHCAGGRVFELQLLSPLIPWLQVQDGPHIPVDYGTVLVYTCEANCWTEGHSLVEEEIVLQADPDQHLYR